MSAYPAWSDASHLMGENVGVGSGRTSYDRTVIAAVTSREPLVAVRPCAPVHERVVLAGWSRRAWVGSDRVSTWSLFEGSGDPTGGLGGCDPACVDGFRLVAEPRAVRVGIGLEVREAKGAVGAEDCVCGDTCTERGLVSVEDEVPCRYGVTRESRADLALVLLDQDGEPSRV